MNPSEAKKFLTFLINYVVDKNPDGLYTNLTHLTKYMTEDLKPSDPLN